MTWPDRKLRWWEQLGIQVLFVVALPFFALIALGGQLVQKARRR